MKTIAIIPARSGSKGLKNKNIKLLNGKPLIAYTIKAAEQSKMFDRIMVSTDSEEYANIAKTYGAEVPFLRSKETASDSASTKDAVLEVLARYRDLGVCFERLMILQPTSPLRTAENIIEATKIFIEKNAKSVISLCEMDHSPLWCNTLPADHSLNNFIKAKGMRRQKLDTYYRINGAIYLFNVDYYQNNENVYTEDSYAYIMDKMQSIDIDDEFDFRMAESILKIMSDSSKEPIKRKEG